ncbi:hypothetical protein GB931_04550 [Modestobacter sp. I12A-02628]|uniref:Uncharacterized protein n=1 Tax=Goekera deserti TaxID=2497753 RepID=A0A7K3WDN8_9ACTN|nr:hypothetical protein [Goekera deserti]MPQ97208.1 hypothetical protein [Goekera deserti]NDI46474.1 hypothetical protein [Goekera deserti]NEL54592.1 hypothetical protein [Goekera deserti]
MRSLLSSRRAVAPGSATGTARTVATAPVGGWISFMYLQHRRGRGCDIGGRGGRECPLSGGGSAPDGGRFGAIFSEQTTTPMRRDPPVVVDVSTGSTPSPA